MLEFLHNLLKVNVLVKMRSVPARTISEAHSRS